MTNIEKQPAPSDPNTQSAKGGLFVRRPVFAIVLTWIILIVMRLIMGDLRVDEEAEHTGLDLSEHSEAAYGPLS